MASGENDTGIVVALVFACFSLDFPFRVVGVVPFAVDVHLDCALYGLIGSSHHSIVVLLGGCLTSARADCGV